MKYAKILGLLAVAAAAMMAFAASASATAVTSNGSVYTGVIKATHEGTHVTLHNAAAEIPCNSSVEGSVESHGSSSTAAGKITSLVFNNCTGGWTVTVNTPGTLEVHTTWTRTIHEPGGQVTEHTNPNSTNNGTLTSSGATVTATNHALGLTCRYATNATDIGTLTGSETRAGDSNT